MSNGKKKPYNVAERFTEVAKRATTINVAPSKKPAPKPETDDEVAYRTRPGAGMKKTGDVNLPITQQILSAGGEKKKKRVI